MNNETFIDSLTPLELRLEISKHLSNLRLDLLKRIYNGQAVLEGCEKGNLYIHIHFSPVSFKGEFKEQAVSRTT